MVSKAICWRGAYIRGELRIFENKPPSPIWAMSSAEKGGAYFRDNTVLANFITKARSHRNLYCSIDQLHACHSCPVSLC